MASRFLRGYAATAARFVPLAATIAVPAYNYELIMMNHEKRAEIFRKVCGQVVQKRPILRIFGMNPVQCVRPSSTPRNEIWGGCRRSGVGGRLSMGGCRRLWAVVGAFWGRVSMGGCRRL